MTSPVIKVENLAKSFRIGKDSTKRGYNTLRESITDMLSAPLRHLKSGAALGNTEEFWALKDINFEVEPGEVVGIIGHNGAGKSTLLKILTGIMAPTKGRVELHGRVGSLLEVGTGFHPELTGRENVYLNGSILGMKHSEVQAKFDEIVEFSGVEKFLDTPIKRYSSGMRVRLAFSVAAFLEPEILIIDEVLAVGDAAFQKKCLGAIGDVAKSGRTVLFVSHNMAAVEALCQRVILLYKGRIECDGAASVGLTNYTSNKRRGSTTEAGTFRRSSNFLMANLIKAVELRTVDDKVIEQVSLGGTAKICIDLSPDHSLEYPSIGLGVDDSLGRRIMTLHSPLGDAAISRISESGTIECSIPMLPLAPGEYSVKVAISERSQAVDVVENALEFTVFDSNQFQTGRSFHKGICVADSHWTYRKKSEMDRREFLHS